MTNLDKQNLQSEKNGLKMDLIFNEEYGANIISEYVVQKESGETPSIDINTIKTKREAVKARMQEIDDTISGLNIECSVCLMNCSYKSITGVFKKSFVKSELTLEKAQLIGVTGNNLREKVELDGVLLVKNVDYTFSDNSLKATNTGLNKITNSNASILKVEFAGD